MGLQEGRKVPGVAVMAFEGTLKNLGARTEPRIRQTPASIIAHYRPNSPFEPLQGPLGPTG